MTSTTYMNENSMDDSMDDIEVPIHGEEDEEEEFEPEEEELVKAASSPMIVPGMDPSSYRGSGNHKSSTVKLASLQPSMGWFRRPLPQTKLASWDPENDKQWRVRSVFFQK